MEPAPFIALFFALLALSACASQPTPIAASLTPSATPAAPTTTPVPPSAMPTNFLTLTATPRMTLQTTGSQSPGNETPAPTPTALAVVTGTFEITTALSALYGPEGLTFTAAGPAQFPANQTFLTSTVKVLIAAPFTENNV
jgi:hypothetical protein